jgi:hypothetical protein
LDLVRTNQRSGLDQTRIPLLKDGVFRYTSAADRRAETEPILRTKGNRLQLGYVFHIHDLFRGSHSSTHLNDQIRASSQGSTLLASGGEQAQRLSERLWGFIRNSVQGSLLFIVRPHEAGQRNKLSGLSPARNTPTQVEEDAAFSLQVEADRL